MNHIYGDKIGQARASYFDNTFTVFTSRIEEISILISPLMVDLSRPVKVIVNGRILFDGKVEPSKAFMIDRFIGSFDRSQVFVAEVKVRVE